MKVAIADDSALFRGGLAMLLDAAGISVTAQAGSGAELLALLTRPDASPVNAIILDIRMPPTFTDEGIRAAHEFRRWSSDVGVLVLSTYVETEYATRLLSEGSAGLGYLLKDHVDEIHVLQNALSRLVAGESVIDQHIVERLLRRRSSPKTERLTARERATLALMAQGRSNAGIATELCISEKTVERYVNTIFNQLDLSPVREDNRRVLAVLSWLRTLDDA